MPCQSNQGACQPTWLSQSGIMKAVLAHPSNLKLDSEMGPTYPIPYTSCQMTNDSPLKLPKKTSPSLASLWQTTNKHTHKQKLPSTGQSQWQQKIPTWLSSEGPANLSLVRGREAWTHQPGHTELSQEHTCSAPAELPPLLASVANRKTSSSLDARCRGNHPLALNSVNSFSYPNPYRLSVLSHCR